MVNIYLNGDSKDSVKKISAGCNYRLTQIGNENFDYYFLMDPTFFQKSQLELEEINTLKSELFEKIRNQDFILVVPKKFKKITKKMFPEKQVESIVFRTIPFANKYIDKFLIKLGFSLSSMNVSFAMISFFMKRKHKLIKIHGARHDWLNDISVNINNQILFEPTGIKNYNSRVLKDYKGKELNMAEFLETQLNNFRTHDRMQNVSNLFKCRIINTCPDSFITSYKKNVEN